MFTTIAGSRKTKQTSHLPTWLVSVDFQQLQFLAFLSLTFSSLSSSTRKEGVVNICYIIAKIYSICAELFSDYTPMIPYGVREWSCRRYKTQDAKMTSYRVLFFPYQTNSIHFALSHFRYTSQWLLKKKGHKGTGRQACHKYSCHLWQLPWATTEQIHVKVKCFFSKSLQQIHHLGKKKDWIERTFFSFFEIFPFNFFSILFLFFSIFSSTADFFSLCCLSDWISTWLILKWSSVSKTCIGKEKSSH